jgi:hypothetical protein
MHSKITFDMLRSYFFAARLLHAITLLDLLIAILLLVRLPDLYRDGAVVSMTLVTILLLFMFSLLILSQLDARSRYQDYKQIKDQLFLYGFNPRILRPVLKSRCQRDAAYRAAEELGLAASCRHLYRMSGYRWYHILPDYTFRQPQFLLSKYFWLTTFFASVYYPRVDFVTGTLLRRRIIQS